MPPQIESIRSGISLCAAKSRTEANLGRRPHIGDDFRRARCLPEPGPRAYKIVIFLQCQLNAELSSAKGCCLNDWLTVTKWVPPVNAPAGHSSVTEGGVTRGHLRADYPRIWTCAPHVHWEFDSNRLIPQLRPHLRYSVALCPSEKVLIDRIRAPPVRAADTSAIANRSSQGLRVLTGIGDDCAVLRSRPGYDTLVTTDFSLEGVHFRRDWHPPESVGHRCLARGLSDIAAMGGEPVAAFLSLALPPDLPQRWVDGFLRGFIGWPSSSA